MLGKVIFESGGVNMEAILTGEGWQCEGDPVVGPILNYLCPVEEYASPAFGSYGAGAVLQAAAFLDGHTVGTVGRRQGFTGRPTRPRIALTRGNPTPAAIRETKRITWEVKQNAKISI